eukprot:SAG31_NODE_224_length_19856_cov_33.632890_3_plen_167_part_00
MTVLHNYGSFLCYPCNPYEGADVCPPLPNGTCWQNPPSRGPFPVTASANGGSTVRIEDCDIFSNAMWNSTADENCAFYFGQIPNNFFVSGSLGFQECPWQVDGCEPKGCESDPAAKHHVLKLFLQWLSTAVPAAVLASWILDHIKKSEADSCIFTLVVSELELGCR